MLYVDSLFAHSPFPPCDSWGFLGSCECGPVVASQSIVTALLREVEGMAVASLRISDFMLTEPGAAFAEAGLTLKGAALMGVLEQMEDWGTDFSTIAPGDFNSCCTEKSDKRRQRGVISGDS